MQLSICIPTYNRCDLLETTLGRLSDQILNFGLNSKVEIIVSDNCSTDGTQSVVNSYSELGVKSIRHKANLGPDGNFFSLFEVAEGDYIWVLGDDDSFSDDLIPFILDQIVVHSFDYLYLRKTGDPRIFERVVDVVDVVTAEQLLARTGITTTFITSQIIKSTLVKSNLSRAKVFLDGMGYFHIYLDALFQSKICLISRYKEIYADTSGNTGGYKFFKVWGERSNDVFKDSYFGTRIDLVDRFRVDVFLYLILPIMFHMRKAKTESFNFSSENARTSMNKYYSGLPYSFFFRLYSYLPWPLLFVVHIPVVLVSKLRKKIFRVAP